MKDFQIPEEIEHYEKKIYDLRQLLEISKSLNSTLEFTVLIESVLLTMIGHMHTFKAGIFLQSDIEDPDYYLHSSQKGFEIDKGSETLKIKADSDIIIYFQKNSTILYIDELRKMDDPDQVVEKFTRIGVEIIVPLKVRERVAGIIILGKKENQDNFSFEEKDFLLTLSSIAAIAVENARLYELATVDMKTRLRIHHYFQARLNEERERAQRENKPLALIITDIDHFKKFNDTYGHLTGDLVLKNVAQILKKSIRNYDIAARYGGEEFTIILPDTSLRTAREVAERVRQNVDRAKIPTKQGILNVRISLGVALFDPDNDKTNEELIEKADRALYHSKKTGRNRVTSYNDL